MQRIWLAGVCLALVFGAAEAHAADAKAPPRDQLPKGRHRPGLRHPARHPRPSGDGTTGAACSRSQRQGPAAAISLWLPSEMPNLMVGASLFGSQTVARRPPSALPGPLHFRHLLMLPTSCSSCVVFLQSSWLGRHCCWRRAIPVLTSGTSRKSTPSRSSATSGARPATPWPPIRRIIGSTKPPSPTASPSMPWSAMVYRAVLGFRLSRVSRPANGSWVSTPGFPGIARVKASWTWAKCSAT